MNKFVLRVLVLVLVLISMFIFVVDKASASEKESVCAYEDRGYCVPGYISNEAWWTPAPQHSYGKAVWYAPYLMNATAEWRGMSLDGFLGGVAMMSPADMGEVVWLKRPGLNWEGPYLVVDVSSRIHIWTTITKIEEIIEVDFDTAVRWGMIDSNKLSWTINEYMIRDVEVYKGLHPPFESSIAIDYVEWFKQDVLAWGNQEYRRWSTDDLWIINYKQYQNELVSYLQVDLSLGGFHGVFSYINEELVKETDQIIDSTLSVQEAHHYTQENLQTVEVVEEITWELNCLDENPYNGFVAVVGTKECVPGVITKESWLMDYPKHTIGVATYYEPGVMDMVVANRGMSLKGYVGGLVMMTCAHIGDSVWVRRSGHGWEGPYLVVDCSQPFDVWIIAQNKLHIEVDYDRWVAWNASGGHQNIELCIGGNDCSGSPVSWAKYWLSRVEWLLPIAE